MQFAQVLEGNKIRCLACNHYCQIPEGKTGICGVRKNVGGQLQLLVDQRPSAVHVDPIEKKPMYHFYPGSEIFSLGTIGCNFRCSFCQNWQLSMSRDIEEVGGQELPASQIIAICKRKGYRLIAFTYNEPTIWLEYNLEICRQAKEAGMETVYVSNGFMSKEARVELAKYITGINIDLKCYSNETYRRIMGGGLEEVKDNIRFFYEAGVVTEVTTLVVPGMNDSEEELSAIADFLAGVGLDIPWHLSAFHPDYKMTDRERTSLESLLRAVQIGKNRGLHNIYVGNCRSEWTDTKCAQCGALLVERPYYAGRVVGIENGKCKACGHPVYGRFQ